MATLSTSQFLTLSDGTQLHVQITQNNSPRWLIATHGIGEHLARHRHLNELFSQQFNLLLYDLRGHGKSSGRRAYVDRFATYYQDLRQLVDFLQTEYAMERFTLFGHSMGASIVCGYLQQPGHQTPGPEKVFLSSPAISLPGSKGVLVESMPLELFQGLGACPFSLELGGLVDLAKLSRDASVGRDYLKDPLNCLKIHSKLVLELVIAMKSIFARPLGVKCPVHCAYGTGDAVVSPTAIEKYFQQVEPTATIRSFTHAYHELHHEIPMVRKEYFRFLQEAMSPPPEQVEDRAT